MKTFRKYADPGHGWLKVPVKILEQLGIQELISGFSYRRGDDAYLEEDGDMMRFIEAFYKKHGTDPKLRTSHTNNRSRIRNYSSYWWLPAEKEALLNKAKKALMSKNFSKRSKNALANGSPALIGANLTANYMHLHEDIAELLEEHPYLKKLAEEHA